MARRARTYAGALVMGVALWLGGAGAGWAQSLPDLRISPAQRLASAQLAMDEGAYDEAVRTLRPLMDERPGFRTAERGAAALTLGHAYLHRGDSTAAHAAYRAGVNALNARDAVDPALFEAYVESVLRGDGPDAKREHRAAAAAYLELLGTAGPGAPPRVQRHAAHTLLLWPDARRQQLTPDPEALLAGTGALCPGADSLLTAWWRRQDPRPATPGNERLIEHLQRIRQAQSAFGADTFLGYDHRGRVYVRLGAPDVRRSLSSGSIAQSTSIDTHFMPRNELWRYKGYGRHSHFLFVEGKHGFVEGGVPDLLPPPMRNGKTGTEGLATLALRDFYDELTPRVPEYASLYDRLAELGADIEVLSTLPHPGVAQMMTSGVDPASSQPRLEPVGRPFFREARLRGQEVRQKRAEEVPASASQAVTRARTLPVAVRTARFLRDDGTTEAEIYWSVRRHGLETPAVRSALAENGYDGARRHWIQMQAQRHRLDYTAQHAARSQHHVRPRDEAQPRTDEPVFSMRLPGVQAPYHLSVQWDQIVEPRRAGRSAATAAAVRTQTSVHWVDSLTTLPADGATLAVSDLVPVEAGTYDPGRPLRTDDGWTAEPYPFRTLVVAGPSATERIGLYLEIYHLARGADHQTRYTVEYAATRTDVPSTNLGKFFRGTPSETTTTATTQSGTSATAHEYLELDLGDLDDLAGADVLTLVVRVTDETTGHTVDRSVRFQVGTDDG